MGAGVNCVWMDQGGTFTDVVAVDDSGQWSVRKVLSDAADLHSLAATADDVRRGTTVATNAVLERTFPSVLVLTTAGFEDVLEFGDQVRPQLFARTVRRRAPLGCRVVSIPGRLSARGEEVVPFDLDALPAVLGTSPPESVAVVLVHGPRAPHVVAAIARRCRELGVQHVTTGVDVAPTADFADRLRTTALDAALTPLLPRNAGRWMCSDGGLADHDSAEWRGGRAVLSGPAGGVVSTAAHARRADPGVGFIGLDMGGTSTDICRVGPGGAVQMVQRLTIDGLDLATPSVRVDTIAAGGGSVLGVQGGVFTVGPGSSGADPGPACYGRGGPLALTDCEAVLGRLPGFPPIAGPCRDQPLVVAAARAALAQRVPSRSVEAAAAGFRRVAHSTMARAVRRVVAESAADPSSHVLVAFGGAGPAHACGVARELGIVEVHVPLLAGVWSAVGIGMARARAERQVSVTTSITAAWQEATEAFTSPTHASLLARHTGTAHTLELSLSDREMMGADRSLKAETTAAGVNVGRLHGPLRERFDAEHRRAFGFVRPDQTVDVVAVRVVAEGAAAPPLVVDGASPAAPMTETEAWFDGRWCSVPVRAVGSDAPLEGDHLGPMMVLLPGSTAVVEAGWSVCQVGDHLVLRDLAPDHTAMGIARDPVQTAVFGARLAGIADSMGETLARLARSVSIRDRRDFSCALFDAEGRLAVNAPHVPVHLGAMGETVRALLQRHGGRLAPGQTWVTNDPYAGGSHLPDITVIQPFFDASGQRVAFLGCRGHHVDVGGVRAGSMPPDATHIDEEGVVIPHHLLVDEAGNTHLPPLPGCRQPDEVAADLLAQVASCTHGARQLENLLTVLGTTVFSAQLNHLRAVASDAVAEALSRFDGTFEGHEVFDDGTPLHVVVRTAAGGSETRVHIEAPAHPGNLNAPTAVARAAVLYVLRCLAAADVPLNEGVLDRVVVSVSPGGLFDPSPPRAVAGGNVETSQRLVDALFVALGLGAASQGTMNNLTVGTSGGAWYETIGGGAGATDEGPGASAVQVHMTNTRATDVEALERRFPVRLDSICRRRGSGGPGLFRGGDGLVKTWTFLAPAEVALLCGRRTHGAPGLQGGLPGAPGRDLRDVGGGFEPAPPTWTARPGDRLRIETPGGGGFGPPDPPSPGVSDTSSD